MKSLYLKAKSHYLKHERHILSFALVFGFIVDIYTFNRVDLLFDNLIIAFYLILSALGIALTNLKAKDSTGLLGKIRSFTPALIQFTLGGLFSGFSVIYSRSSAIGASWPFLILIFTLLIGNEFFREKYEKFYFQVSIWYTAVFLYLIFLLPVLFNKIGPDVFLFSGLCSLVLMFFLVGFILKYTPKKTQLEKDILTLSVGVIFVVINIFYFLNLIPPIPLSLKDAGVYNSIEQQDGNFILIGEKKTLWEKIKPFKTARYVPGEKLYVFSAVFAPLELNTRIVHQWQYYDRDIKEWKNSSRIEFGIVGGREQGFRGYSFKENIFPGKWRVIVETTRGQVLGRINFNLELAKEKQVLVREIK